MISEKLIYLKTVFATGGLMFLISIVAPTPASAATINFTGTLEFILIDNGSSIYSGLSVGETFSGSFTYGNNVSDASEVDISGPTLTNYIFTGPPFDGFITNGSITTTAENARIGIEDNDTIDDDAAIINSLYGAGSTTASAIADRWSVDTDINDNQGFGIALFSLDTSLYSSTDFQVFPPTLANSDFAYFALGEDNSLGDNIYGAVGRLSSISVVPIPAAAWLFGTALIGFVGMSRRRKVG